MPPYQIRPATPSDLPNLAHLFLLTRQSTFTWQPPSSFQLSDFAPQTEGEAIHLAETSDGTLLGFISIWEPDQFIHHLFVHPDHQGQGIGTALLHSLSSWLPYPHRLKCLLANERALQFYHSQGWTELSRSEDPTGPYALLEYTAPAPRQKLLFICARNKIRSLTAERLFQDSPHYDVRSRGVSPQARIRLTAADLTWADRIFVMEKEHKRRLLSTFPGLVPARDVTCLFIEDIYEPMEPALIQVLQDRLADHLK